MRLVGIPRTSPQLATPTIYSGVNHVRGKSSTHDLCNERNHMASGRIDRQASAGRSDTDVSRHRKGIWKQSRRNELSPYLTRCFASTWTQKEHVDTEAHVWQGIIVCVHVSRSLSREHLSVWSTLVGRTLAGIADSLAKDRRAATGNSHSHTERTPQDYLETWKQSVIPCLIEAFVSRCLV